MAKKNWDMVIGKRYKVRYLPDGARTKTREITAKLIGVAEDQVIFSGRDEKPDFGTAWIAPSQIRAVKEVE